MYQYKIRNVVIICLLILTIFGSSLSLNTSNSSLTEQTIILEKHIHRLGDGSDNYLKYQNSTGIYEITNRIIIELESFVEPQWQIDYREYLEDKEKYEKQQKQHQNFEKACNKIFGLLFLPFSFFSFFDIFSTTASASRGASIIVDGVTSTARTVIPMVDNFLSQPIEPAGFGSGDLQPRFDVGESNETHVWVDDPTNQTDGCFIEVGSGYNELNVSRGATYRHFYNETSSTFTYMSDLLVNKTGVIDDTDWVTPEEYPCGYILRLINGSTYRFTTPAEISDFMSLIENNTVWGIGTSHSRVF